MEEYALFVLDVAPVPAFQVGRYSEGILASFGECIYNR
jgi:hypothetical protein